MVPVCSFWFDGSVLGIGGYSVLISLTCWSLLKDQVVLSFLFIFCLLAAVYSLSTGLCHS